MDADSPPVSRDAAALRLGCPRCHVAGEDGDRFCPICGTALAVAGSCAHCGRTPPPSANFCPACGNPVMPAQVDAATPAVAVWDVPVAPASPLEPHGRFGRRLAASLIDLVCVAAVWFATSMVWAFAVAAANGRLAGAGPGWGLVLLLALPAATAALYIWSESSGWQATPGKRAVGLQVARLDGRRVTAGTATGRFFARLLSLATLGGGYLWMLAERERLAIHDSITDTVVRRRVRPGPGGPPRPA